MKIKDGFVLRNIAGQYVVMSLGEGSMDFSRLITLNETGSVLWNRLAEGAQIEDLTAALLAEYDVDEATAARDAAAFVDKIRQAGMLEE